MNISLAFLFYLLISFILLKISKKKLIKFINKEVVLEGRPAANKCSSSTTNHTIWYSEFNEQKLIYFNNKKHQRALYL